MAIATGRQLGVLLGTLRLWGLWQVDLCHNPNSRNALSAEIATTPIRATPRERKTATTPKSTTRRKVEPRAVVPRSATTPKSTTRPAGALPRRTNAYSRADPESSSGQMRNSRARVLVNRDLRSASLTPCTGGTAWYTLHSVAPPCEKYDRTFVRPCQISVLPGEPRRAAASMRLLSRKRSSIRLSQPGGAVPSPIYD